MPGIYGDPTYGDPTHMDVGHVYKYSADMGTAWGQIAELSVSRFNRGFLTFSNTNSEEIFQVKIFGSTNTVRSDPGGEVIDDGWVNVAEVSQSGIYASSDYNHNAEITVAPGKVVTVPITIPLQYISIYAKGSAVGTVVKAFGYFMR